jgi:enoyl-CoA hydratase/carnithine racemase
MGKEGFYALSEMNYKQALDDSERMISILSSTEDSEEGIQAFLQKRRPQWKRR